MNVAQSVCKTVKEVVYLAYVHTCPASLRTWITKEPNFSYGKSHCQGVLEVSDLRLLHNLGNFNDSVGGLANLMSLFSGIAWNFETNDTSYEVKWAWQFYNAVPSIVLLVHQKCMPENLPV